MKKLLSVILCVLLSFSLLAGCSNSNKNEQENKNATTKNEQEKSKDTSDKKEKGSIILATTTSTEDSGLLDYLLPKFKEETGIDVKVVSVGTGQALKKGEDGDADILLVHAKSDEEKFVKEGHGLQRHDVMYNDFILVGPKNDPLKLKENSPNDIVAGLKTISDKQGTFVSRGDESGTHKKELKLWETANLKPEGKWYVSAGSGMGEVLKIASEKQGYTITDRATYLKLKDTLDLDIVIEKEDNLYNQYGIIPVNPNKNKKINKDGAKEFEEWILSEKTQKLIGEYGKKEFGQSLFIPNAK
ncbi:family 1 extracellular solute-binding protein [Gottschalkia purinilytica]|uniref:Family 1 extracellular solute-binding protein n=1 Tax=Gottschalkia purinilytica TaxID=1503 RepID=A0A0L0W6U4_GOTPU|nr:substrate-binding domain-containing protein [Gottschalkia purinilytica]KNF07273.1 family 1 extracellular solute-binding protein [Gottschalkia purinilytica]